MIVLILCIPVFQFQRDHYRAHGYHDHIGNNNYHILAHHPISDPHYFIDKCKISHARRVFTEIDSNVTMVKKRKDSDKTGSPNIGPYGQNKIINKQDIKEGIRYIKTDDDTKNNSYINSMYI